jgi:adenine-specific DNA-methyltransferase
MDYIHQPMITYLGNKRKLVSWIMDVVHSLPHRRILDGFAGSGVISRAFRSICSELHSNDMEYYSYVLQRCFLETPTVEQRVRIDQHARLIKDQIGKEGFVTRLYAPQNTLSPQPHERCFYTRQNAMKIDAILSYIFSVEEDIRHYLLGPLLIKSSIHVNTAGVFRGFYKKEGVGHFGGAGENALERIMAPIQWTLPIWSESPCQVHCYQSDLLPLVRSFADDSLDLIYLDPPYNEHPYGSNYFMLNLIAKNEEPTEYSRVSGIPKEWNKSAFNGRGKALDAMRELLQACLTKTRYILLSYNNEGLITEEQWVELFTELGCHAKTHQKEYDTYHGSRNLAARNKKVMEQMYVISRVPW